MNINEFINSGQIEAYVLGMLPNDEAVEVARLISTYPELKQEADAIIAALQQYGSIVQLEEKKKLFSVIDMINRDEADFQRHQLPRIHKHSDLSAWQEAVLHKKFPVTESYPTHKELLYDDGTVTLYLVTTISDIAPETHSFEKESFFVLQGSCTCYVGDNIYHLSAGGYMDIPMHISHNVQVHPAQTVVAVLQHIKMAG